MSRNVSSIQLIFESFLLQQNIGTPAATISTKKTVSNTCYGRLNRYRLENVFCTKEGQPTARYNQLH